MSQPDGKNHTCRLCHQKYTKRHYEENKAYYIAKARRNDTRIVAELKAMRTVPCPDCGGVFPWYVMDFDHVRGEKMFNLSRAHRATGRLKALEEAAKCEVVCSNCHRARTYKRRRGCET